MVKPNYNSAIATFCYKISKGQKIELKINKKIILYYIDDLVNYLISLLKDDFTSYKIIKKFKNLKKNQYKIYFKKIKLFQKFEFY